MLIILASTAFTLVSCLDTDYVPPINPGGDGDNDDTTKDDEEDNEGTSPSPEISTIVVPTYKDYERGTVDYDKLTYKRPDVDELRADFAAAKEAVKTADTEDKVNSAIELIRSLEESYTEFKTMSTMAEIGSYQNSADERWAKEYEDLSVARSSVAQAVEELIVAAANSSFIEKYENDYFGYDIDEYKDGGIYTDVVVGLMGEEAALVAEYNDISTATLVLYVEMYGESGTYDELIEAAAKKYDSREFLQRATVYDYVYNATAREKTGNVYVDLLKKRKEIADQLGLSSYAEFMYDEMGYEYSIDDMTNFFGHINGTVFGIYKELLNVLHDYLLDKKNKPDALGRTKLINTLYSVYSNADEGLLEAYSYMLQHRLYDISGRSSTRFEGAFTAYLDSNSSPFLFATINGNITDFSSVSHEFGHFYDAYINYNANNSLELCEVSSQALEFMTLNMLKDTLSTGYQYMRYYYVYNALNTIIYQSIYSLFEHLAYALPYDEISVERLNELVSEAATVITGSPLVQVTPYEKVEFNSIHYVLVPHMFVSPMYVQSYVTSIIPAIEIYSLEENEKGAGLSVYKTLVAGATEDRSFTEHLKAAGLHSPFDEGMLESIASVLRKLAIGIPYSVNDSVAA